MKKEGEFYIMAFKCNTHIKLIKCIDIIRPNTIGRVIEILPNNQYKIYFYKYRKYVIVPEDYLKYHLTYKEYRSIIDPIDELGSMH
jgi:hypothetical protein